MINKFQILLILMFLASLILAQEKDEKQPIKNSVNGVEAPQAVEGDVIFSDGTNQILRITDEGTTGAIQFPSGVPSVTTNKLYNDNGALHFNGNPLNFGNDNGWIIADTNLYSTQSGNVGIGTSTPVTKLEVNGKLKTTDLQIANGAYVNAVLVSETPTGTAQWRDISLGMLDDCHRSSDSYYIGKFAGHTENFNLNLKCIGIGSLALYANTSGINNIAIGNQTLRFNTTGKDNIGIGNQAIHNNTLGSSNIGIGSSTLKMNTEGNNNIGIGGQALLENTTGSRNTAIGIEALKFNTVGEGNSGLGYQALASNISGNDNTAIGQYALTWNTLGSSNTAIGAHALIQNELGTHNTAIGSSASRNNTSGSKNVVIGANADFYNQAGINNTIIGYNAGQGPSLHNKSGNVFLGHRAGVNETGDNKLYIENSDTTSPLIYGDFTSGNEKVIINGNFRVNGKAVFGSTANASGTNSFAIGSNVNASGNGTIFIGDNSPQASIQNAGNDNRFAARFSNGYRFFTTADLSVGAKMDAGDNAWSVASDSTKKENFKLVDGEEILNRISKFNLTSWNYKTQDPAKFRHYGPMAQDFFAAFGNDGIGTIGNDTTIASADFDGINFIAIQALENRSKEQVSSIQDLESRIKELEAQNQELAKINAEIRTENAEIRNQSLELFKNIEQIKEAVQIIKSQNKNVKMALFK